VELILKVSALSLLTSTLNSPRFKTDVKSTSPRDSKMSEARERTSTTASKSTYPTTIFNLVYLYHFVLFRPRFVIDAKLQTHLNRYHGKEQICPAKSQNSIYQKGFRMVFLNPVPVAAAAQMGPDVVKDCMAAIFGAVEDLIRQDRDISLQMGFANLRFTNKSLKVYFADYMTK
jgi:hypothetical protein